MLNEALRLLRVFHDLKQAELAERLGVSKSYISELEKGNRNPSLDVIQKYADSFSLPASSILFFSEELASQTDDTPITKKARSAIATKVINMLKVIEERTGVSNA